MMTLMRMEDNKEILHEWIILLTIVNFPPSSYILVFEFDGFSIDMCRSMVAMKDVS